jgi:serine/threonine-protein kinase
VKPGDLIENRYQIERQLGEGGMGSVYLAYDRTLEKKVALKTLVPQLMSDQRAVEQLRKEVRISQQLRHENICATFDFRENAAEPFMVMEFVDGDVLTNFIYRQPGQRCDEWIFRSLAEQILGALDHAHRAGVIHRDLKSGNIMVTAGGSVRVMDFGIAASIKEVGSRTTGSRVSLSIHYASPEQINGEPPSVVMDIYSLGCVFYEMLEGHPPFYQGDVIVQQLTRQPEPIAGVSPEITEVVLGCLAKDPTQRFRSAAHVRAALAGDRTVLVDRTVAGPTPAWAAPTMAVAPRRRRPVLWASVAAAAVVGGALLWQVRRPLPAPAAPAPAQPPPAITPGPAEPAAPPASARSGPEGPDGAGLQAGRSRGIPDVPPAPPPSDAARKGLARAQEAMSQGRYDEAIAAYRAVLRLDGRSGEARAGLASAESARRAEAALGGDSTAGELLDRAERLFQQEGNYDAAIRVYEEALALVPGSLRARDGLKKARAAKAAEEAIGGKRPGESRP